MEETLDQKDVLGSELDSVSPQTENIQANVGQDTLNADRKKDMLSIEKLQEQLHLDQQQVSVRKATESDVDIDYFWPLDLFTANAAQEQKRVFEEKLHLQAQAYKAQALEQENVKLSAELNHTQSMCERLQWKIRKLELEMTNNSPENNMVTSLQEDLQREREHLTAVNEVSDLMYKLDCKESQLVAEREKASEEISVLKAQVNQATEHKKEFQILLESMEMELLHVKEMNLNLKTQNKVLEQGNLELSAKLNQLEAKQYVSLQRDIKTGREQDIAAHKYSDLHEIYCKENQLVVESEKGSEEMEKEMNLNLKMKNTLLEQGNLELCAKLSHIEAKQDTNAESIQYLVRESKQVQQNVTGINKKVSDLLAELRHMEKKLIKKLEKAAQEKTVLQVQVHEAQASAMELRLQQQNIRLTDKERECRKIEEDLRNTQKANEMLKEELYSIFMECDRMKKKYNENQLKFKQILYQAKRKFNKKTEGLDSTIQKLEKEVKRLTSLLTEEKERFSEYRMKHKHKDRVRSSDIREELGVGPLLLRVERSQMRWHGHLVRMPPGRLPGEVFRACSSDELEDVAGKREVWASLLRLLPPRPDPE
ncbi:hypothetical protein D4764_08G0010930 [Takifugu flavidus]|uniref:Uncharacterized protein n=1 Tax=Takifugu flavidus TaxID=433684 RepID=A0A5C6MPL9_9TELE|nr:hypothetical protein D4764_08G0010930 [Takifugu flavidus]